MTRDLRIDFFRGTALILLLWFHLVWFSGLQSPFFRLTPAFWGFSDAAELFVFLAGFVTGAVYWPGLNANGFLLTECRALHRSSQLYLANVFTFVIVAASVAAMHVMIGADLEYLAPLFSEPVEAIPRAVGLTYIPFGFNILPLYMVLLAVAPLFMAVYRVRPAIALALSAAVYLCAQLFSDLNFPRYEGGRWPFNPFAWQLVFFIGVTLGVRRRMGIGGVSYARWLACLCFALLAVAPIMRFFVILANRDWFGLGAYRDLLTVVTFPYAGVPKMNENPLRLLHFLALVYVVAHFTRNDHRFWRSRIAAPVICCGQQSLEVYCTHLMFLYPAGCLMDVMNGGKPLLLALFAVSVTGIVSAAYLARWKKSQPWRSKLQSASNG